MNHNGKLISQSVILGYHTQNKIRSFKVNWFASSSSITIPVSVYLDLWLDPSLLLPFWYFANPVVCSGSFKPLKRSLYHYIVAWSSRHLFYCLIFNVYLIYNFWQTDTINQLNRQSQVMFTKIKPWKLGHEHTNTEKSTTKIHAPTLNPVFKRNFIIKALT